MLLISGVSAMGKMGNVVDQWCFSNGKMREMLLISGVSAMGKK
jgi:hypothetical protein